MKRKDLYSTLSFQVSGSIFDWVISQKRTLKNIKKPLERKDLYSTLSLQVSGSIFDWAISQKLIIKNT